MTRSIEDSRARARLVDLEERAIAHCRRRQPAWEAAIKLPEGEERRDALKAIGRLGIPWGDAAVKAVRLKGRSGERRGDFRISYFLRGDRIPAAKFLSILEAGLHGVVDLPKPASGARGEPRAKAQVVPFPSLKPVGVSRKTALLLALADLLAARELPGSAARESVLALRAAIAENAGAHSP